MTDQPAELFFSYSNKDESFLDSLTTHLALMRRQGLIHSWHDRKITAGSEWAGEIDNNLNSADIILLLISANFLASDYCYDIEVTRAMERHNAGEAQVIPIILNPIEGLNHTPFAKLKTLPKDAKPVTTWDNQESAFADIAKSIREYLPKNAGNTTQKTTAHRAPAANQLQTNAQSLNFNQQKHKPKGPVPTWSKQQNLVQESGDAAYESNTNSTEVVIQENSLELDIAAIQKAGQERLAVLDKQVAELQRRLQEALPEPFQEGLEWLKNNQESVSISASQHALQKLPSALASLSKEEQEDFQWDIEKYIESVYYAVSDGSSQILEEPAIGPSIDVPKAYQIAFSFIKEQFPSRLSKDFTKSTSSHFDYLLERLFIA